MVEEEALTFTFLFVMVVRKEKEFRVFVCSVRSKAAIEEITEVLTNASGRL